MVWGDHGVTLTEKKNSSNLKAQCAEIMIFEPYIALRCFGGGDEGNISATERSKVVYFIVSQESGIIEYLSRN